MDNREFNDMDVISISSSSVVDTFFGYSSDGGDGSDGVDGADAVVMALKDRIETLEVALATLEASGKERDAKLECIERMVHPSNGTGEVDEKKMASQIAPTETPSTSSFAPAATPTTTSTSGRPNTFPKTEGFTPSAATDLVDSLDFSTKGQIWGTAFASILIGMARQYKSQESRKEDLLIDEVAFINRCIMLIDETRFFIVPLQGDRLSNDLTRVIRGTDDLPFVTAKAFQTEMGHRDELGHRDRQQIKSALEGMFRQARQVPECFGYPFSQLLPKVGYEIVRPNKMRGAEVEFVIPLALPDKESTVWETWCQSLELTDLAYYMSLVKDGCTRRKAAKQVTLRFPKPVHDV